ncbi:hypothetical protein TNCV_3318881 [Trichonephila clavipes]|nr:hypothetical protein TNCV_3318881 [Trichonephila clavipes]
MFCCVSLVADLKLLDAKPVMKTSLFKDWFWWTVMLKKKKPNGQVVTNRGTTRSDHRTESSTHAPQHPRSRKLSWEQQYLLTISCCAIEFCLSLAQKEVLQANSNTCRRTLQWSKISPQRASKSNRNAMNIASKSYITSSY